MVGTSNESDPGMAILICDGDQKWDIHGTLDTFEDLSGWWFGTCFDFSIYWEE